MILSEETLKLKQDFDEVYNAGYEAGKAEGGGDGWYDTFWDNYLNNGNNIAGDYSFAGYRWTDDVFNPKHNIKPTTAPYMFYRSQITDLKGILERKGLTLDTSQCSNFAYMFSNSEITKLGIIDLRNGDVAITRTQNTFNTPTLQYIEKVIVHSKNYAYHISMFTGATSLTHVMFEGTIYQNFTINASTLDLESAKSVLLALKNHAGTTNEFAYNISLSSGTWSVLDADGATSPNGNTWREYVNDIGWNVG